MAGFIFGGDTGMSYESLKRRREMANAMMARKNSPQFALEGLGHAAESIVGALMNKKLDKREGEMRGAFNDRFTAALGGGMPTVGGFVPQSASMPSGGGAEAIKAGMVKRGLPEHVADAFILNFEDESNLDPGINEENPTVPGSRGGFGLAQWTGPRRKQLEAFAAQRGTPVSDLDTQLDFLMVELQGSESKAAQSILGAPDTGSAAVAIVNDFLRPAEEHRTRRAARYRGVGGSAPQMGMAQYAQLANDPMATPGHKAVLEAMMQRQMQANDPARQLDMEYKQAQLDKLRNPAPEPLDTQYVDGVGLIDKQSGEVINDFGGAKPKDRPMKKAADGRWRYSDGEKELVYPDIEAGGDDMTESERRIFMFNSIQKQTGPAIDRIEQEGFDPSNLKDRFANGVLGGNWVKSQEGQMYDAAAGAWSESALRLATGAAATPEEYTRIKGMYFAQVGDSLETIEFKRAMRESYQAVLGRTLSGETGDDVPNPLMFAIDQFYANREQTAAPLAAEAATAPAATEIPPAPDYLSKSDAELWEFFTEEERELIKKGYGGR